MKLKFRYAGDTEVDLGPAETFAQATESRGYAGLLRSFARGLEEKWSTTRVVREAHVNRIAQRALDNPGADPCDLLEAEGILTTKADFANGILDAFDRPGGLVDGMARAFGLPRKDASDRILRDLLAALDATARPDWRRVVPRAARAEVAYVPEVTEGGDARLSRKGDARGALGIEPDHGLVAFLDLANVSSDDVVAASVAAGEPEPGPGSGWRRVAHRRDLDRPMLLLPAEAAEVLAALPNGGTPLFFARVRLHEILGRPPGSPFRTLEGGMVGVHDFDAGTGRIEPPNGVGTFPGFEGWRVVGSLSGVHDVAPEFLDVVLENAESPSPWRRVGTDAWRMTTGDGGASEVTRTLGKDRVEEFWLQTLDADGTPDGPFATPEVWLDLEDAQRAGNEAAQAIAAAPAP